MLAVFTEAATGGDLLNNLKSVLNVFATFTEKNLFWSLFLIKLQ